MADGSPILLSYLPAEEKKWKKDGGGLVEKEVHEKMVSPKYNNGAITTCNMKLSYALLSSVDKEKKNEKRILLGSYISFRPTQRRKIQIS